MRMVFDDLVGAGEHCGRDRDADLSRYLEVKDQLEPGGLLGRRIAGATSGPATPEPITGFIPQGRRTAGA
jgi:hypothetical protein